MADYKYRVSGTILCPGHEDIRPEVYPETGWIDMTTTSGSRDTQAVIRNGDYPASQKQRVDINVTNRWSVRWDKNNYMYVDLNCTVNSVNGSIYQGGGSNYLSSREIVFRNYDGGGEVRRFGYSADATGLIQGSFGMGSWTLGPISPKSESNKNSFYVCNWSVGWGSEDVCNVYVDKITAGIGFYNNRSLEYDKPVINSTSCQGYSSGGKFSANVNFGDYRNGAGQVTFQIATDSAFTNIVYETTKGGNNNQTQTIEMTRTGLQPNTRYYVRYRAYNGAKYSDYATCNFVTLVTNNLSDPTALKWDQGQVHLAIQMGGNVYTNPQTKIYARKCGTTNWVEKVTRTTKTVADVKIEGLDANTCYEVQARTTTPAGTYTGNTVSFTTPQKNIATAYFTKIEPEFDEEGNQAIANMCYQYESNAVPVDISVYYRVKNGFDPTWQHTDVVTFNELTGEYCFTIEGLIPNQTVYETYIKTTVDGNDWQGQISEFITPIQPIPDNCTCANMQYLVDLICQAVKPLYKGNKTIYANPTTKELCDPYSKNPTFATLWSRLLRFDHAAVCVMCDMLALMKVKGGKANQYYVGEIGWVDLATEIVEGVVDLPTSKAVKDYLAEKIHEVWHFHSSVDYLTGTVAELPTTGLTTGMTAIETSTSHQYKWNGSAWLQDTTFEVDDFAVFHVNESLDSSYGYVQAGEAYYYFEGSWNNLDADTQDLERRVTFLENALVLDKQSTTEEDIMVQTNEADFDYTSLPEGQRVVCFVVEDQTNPKTYHPVTYYYYDGGSRYMTQQVESGKKPTRPADPTRIGYVFDGWVDGQGQAFDFTQTINGPTQVFGTWTAVNYTVSFNSNGGTPATIPDQIIPYGGFITDPGVTLTGYDFTGWYFNTELITISTPVTQNMNLVASWEAWKVVVSFDPRYEDGTGTFEEQTTYGGTVAVPTTPVRTGYTFLGWKDASNDLPFNFNDPLYANASVYADWQIQTFTITFNSDGGTAVPSQTVNYGSLATVPTPPPTKTNFAFAGWYDGNGNLFDFATPITASVTLTAHWEAAYVVTFNGNGGTPVPATQYILPGGMIEEPATDPSKTGYDWHYWEYNGNEWHFDTDIPSGDMTLNANFTIHYYTVTFDTGGAPSTIVAPAAQSIAYMSTATNPWQAGSQQYLNPEDDHTYANEGWTLNGANFDFTTPITSDITLVATWGKLAKVTFNPNGGTLTDAARQDVAEGGKVTQPTDPAYNGEIFQHWYKDNVGGIFQGPVEPEESESGAESTSSENNNPGEMI